MVLDMKKVNVHKINFQDVFAVFANCRHVSFPFFSAYIDFDGSWQDCRKSIANALELPGLH